MNNEDKLFNLLEKIYIELQDTKTELKEFRVETNTRFDSLDDKLNDLEGTNAANHVAIGNKLNKVSRDLDFLTHKEFQTEKELYDLKQRLIRQRKNIK
ncbi:hypothetical protein KQI38_07470 [Tissierella carlieri]|uniref:hypothetical protein n=1 Tax=Tissierella carlieri TaxID=689904 RepID=UPI001C1209BA|nr:hypothetical protein [Tissierella carlieri]MBU5311865.1 hypothetical protein [Tissierella carlieri]